MEAARTMRWFTIGLLFLFTAPTWAQNDYQFAQVIKRGNVRAIDRYMERLIAREGKDVRPGSTMHPLGGAEGRIGELWSTLRSPTGVAHLDCDRCVVKPAIWPGQWRLGVVFRTKDGHSEDVLERCYTIQGGRTGTVNIFGWRPRIRSARDDLQLINVCSCPGFVEAQRALCEERWPGH